MTCGRPARKILSRRNPFSRPIDYEAAIASDLREIAWAEARIRTAATISAEERAACPLGVGVDLMWYLRPEATREERWRALSGTGLDVLERAELARLRARLARHRRNRETYGRREVQGA